MNHRKHDNTKSTEAGQLDLHPVGADEWVGVVFYEGVKQGETGPMPSIEAAKREAAKRFRAGLRPSVWSQDGNIIVSEPG